MYGEIEDKLKEASRDRGFPAWYITHCKLEIRVYMFS